MSEKQDRTAAIFAKLGVRIGTHPYWFKVTPPNQNNLWEPKYKLTEPCIESDGIAVRLWRKFDTLEIYQEEGFYSVSYITHNTVQNTRDTSFAHAVHDALVEALGIGEETP